MNWSIISNEKLINGTNKHVKNDALMFNRKKIERSRELSSNECNERVNTHLFASTSLWANNVSWNTWSHPCVFLLLCTQTCAYMGKIPRKFALAIVNRCPAKKTRSTVVNKFSCCKNFSLESHSWILLCLSVSKLFHREIQGRSLREVATAEWKECFTSFFSFFFRKNAWKRKEKGGKNLNVAAN